MGELTTLEKLRQWIGDCGYKLFLWSRGWTDEQFVDLVQRGGEASDGT